MAGEARAAGVGLFPQQNTEPQPGGCATAPPGPARTSTVPNSGSPCAGIVSFGALGGTVLDPNDASASEALELYSARFGAARAAGAGAGAGDAGGAAPASDTRVPLRGYRRYVWAR